MKINFKKLFAFAASLSVSGFLFALETGGLFTNDTKFANVEKGESLKLDQKNGLNLWLRTPISEDGTSYFVTEGSFKTEFDASESDSDEKFKLTLDLDLCKLVLKKQLDESSLLFSAGRFYFSDLSGLVLSQNADGAQLDFTASRFGVSVYAAYTGLLNAKNISIIDDSATTKAKEVYTLADKYVLAGLQFSLPNLFAGQSIALEGLGTFCLDSDDYDTYNRIYATISLSGPVVSTASLYYNLSSTFGFAKFDDGTSDESANGNLTKASVSWYPDFKSASVSLNGVYASGSQGAFDGFIGFTSQTAVEDLTEAEYSGLLKLGLSGSIKPIDTLLASLNTDLVFDASESLEFAGFQYSLGCNWQIVSDVSAGASFSQFIGSGDYADTGNNLGGNKTQLKISASIAF